MNPISRLKESYTIVMTKMTVMKMNKADKLAVTSIAPTPTTSHLTDLQRGQELSRTLHISKKNARTPNMADKYRHRVQLQFLQINRLM